MESSNLPPTALAHKLINELTFLAEMLSPANQRIIRRFSDDILQERSPIADATNLLPLEAALVVILVKEHERNNHEIEEIYKEIQELRRQIQELKPSE